MAADLFCGAGGTSTGLVLAARELGLPLKLLAINHWQAAIDTHSMNHPDVEHRCESLDNVDPRKAVPGGRLNLLIASPECTHHSNARGGRPMSDQSRASAWVILRWAEALYIDTLLIENVREFRNWGPLGANGRPIKRLRGQLYLQFLNSLRALGYNVEDRILNAADYGDPTTRERLFIIARRGGKPIHWPVATHAPTARTDLFEYKLRAWRPAREVIDWKLRGESIFTRKRPLAPKTVERIIAGLKKFGGVNAEPFIVVLRNNHPGKSVNEPLPTLCASGKHLALCEPFVIPQQSKGAPRSADEPLPTVATKGAIALVEPFLLNIDHRGGNGSQVTKARTCLVEPFLVAVNHGEDPVPHGGNGRRTHSVDAPLPTVTTKRNLALIDPFIVPFFGERDGQTPRVHSVEEPLPTVTGQGAGALVEPFLVKFNGTAKARPVDEPLDTVTSKDRFALVTAEGTEYLLDIRFRMLQPHELARAQGFPDSYQFKGNREEVVRQIGNAVPVNLARALCSTILKDQSRRTRKDEQPTAGSGEVVQRFEGLRIHSAGRG